MEFNPTYNYGQEDLNIEQNLILWNFGELIKTLIMLSSAAETQKEIIGLGAAAEEMAIDFDNYFTSVYQSYCEKDLLNSKALSELKELDCLLEERSSDKYPDFWDDALLDTNVDWERVREMAKGILIAMSMDNLILEFKREQKYSTTKQGKQLLIEYTKIKLRKI